MRSGGVSRVVLFSAEGTILGLEAFNLSCAICMLVDCVYLILTCYSSAGKLSYFDDNQRRYLEFDLPGEYISFATYSD